MLFNISITCIFDKQQLGFQLILIKTIC